MVCWESSAFSRRLSCSSSAEGGGHLCIFQPSGGLWSGEQLGGFLVIPDLPKDLLCQLTRLVFWHDSSTPRYRNGYELQEFLSFSCRNVFQWGRVKMAQSVASSHFYLIWHICGYEIQLELWKLNVICRVISHFSPRLLFTWRSCGLFWRAQGRGVLPQLHIPNGKDARRPEWKKCRA